MVKTQRIAWIWIAALAACGGSIPSTDVAAPASNPGATPAPAPAPSPGGIANAPGTPPPAQGGVPIPPGASGSNRFEVGAANGLYLVDPAAGEASVQGWVVVTLGAIGGGGGFLPPADTVVTLNGVPLLRDPALNGTFFRLDPAGPQPVVGSGGQMVVVASGSDPQSGKPIQRQLVMDCPSDIQVDSTPMVGGSLAGASTVRVTSSSNLTFNVGVPLMINTFPQAALYGYDPASRSLAPSGSPQNIAPGPLEVTLPVTATAAGAYLLDLRWPGRFVLDGQSGGFCGLAKRWTYTK
jgi:hypothetical protein